jgi:hypothetical protein
MVSLNQLKAFLEIEARLDILHGRLEQSGSTPQKAMRRAN